MYDCSLILVSITSPVVIFIVLYVVALEHKSGIDEYGVLCPWDLNLCANLTSTGKVLGKRVLQTHPHPGTSSNTRTSWHPGWNKFEVQTTDQQHLLLGIWNSKPHPWNHPISGNFTMETSWEHDHHGNWKYLHENILMEKSPLEASLWNDEKIKMLISVTSSCKLNHGT